jgi:DNA polymerase III epsilon subunit-like protein
VKGFLFDTETTGLVKNSLVALEQQPRVIEFFGHLVDSESGQVLDEIEFFCDPGVPLDPVITKITGIRPEQLAGQPPFRTHCDRIAGTIGNADAVIAHNLSFDMALLNMEFTRVKCDIAWPRRKICTVEETEWIKSHRLSLGMLHEELFGEPFSGAHRARTDVDAMTRCWLELCKRGWL